MLALEGGEVDLINGIVPTGAEAMLNSSKYKVFGRKSSGHREISMRTDQAAVQRPAGAPCGGVDAATDRG